MKSFIKPTKPKLISALILSIIFFQPTFINGVFMEGLSLIPNIPIMLWVNSTLSGREVPGWIYTTGSPILFIISNFLAWYLVSCVMVYLAATQKKNR